MFSTNSSCVHVESEKAALPRFVYSLMLFFILIIFEQKISATKRKRIMKRKRKQTTYRLQGLTDDSDASQQRVGRRFSRHSVVSAVSQLLDLVHKMSNLHNVIYIWTCVHSFDIVKVASNF